MTRLAGCLLGAILAAATACSTPSPVPGSVPVSADPPNRYGAPAVVAARDVRPFDARPCGVLSPAQLRGLGLATTGRPRTTVTDDDACSWGSGTVDQNAGIILVPSRDALADTYRTRLLAIFQPITVGGLPAVQQRSRPGSSNCDLTVGTDESQGFLLDYFIFGTPAGEIPDEDACVRARRVAEQVVANLPPLVKN